MLERGDVVTYDVTGVDGMRHWTTLNGRVGVITSGPHTDIESKYSSERWGVNWLLDANLSDFSDFTDGAVHNYPTRFLTKIGHIDLPPAE